MAEILAGAATPAQIAGFIVALRMKGETVDELAGLLGAMYGAAERVELDDPTGVVDVVGTGGDRSHTINVSTLAALVVAGAGGRVCKHGNRAASSACGSADVLEALGVAIDLGPDGVARCVETAGMGFCFAPRFHPAMRHAVPTRRELGVPTVFNFLGPLANPAGVRRQLIGVSDPAMAERMVGVLAARGAERVIVVYGHDGLDELTTTTTSTVLDYDGDSVARYEVDPVALGLRRRRPPTCVGATPPPTPTWPGACSAARRAPARRRRLNAAAGLVVAGLADDLAGRGRAGGGRHRRRPGGGHTRPVRLGVESSRRVTNSRPGELRFYFGTMGSGKSTLALQIHHNLSARGLSGRLCSLFDRGGGGVSSRLGVRAPAVEVGPDVDLFDLATDVATTDGAVDYLVCDEAQFYTDAQIEQLVRVCDQLGADVYAFGLLTDFQGRFFAGAARLIEVADTRQELQVEARCWCGSRASQNAGWWR